MTTEHVCNEMKNGYTILYIKTDFAWQLISSKEDIFINEIYFCPWCGANLEEST